MTMGTTQIKIDMTMMMKMAKIKIKKMGITNSTSPAYPECRTFLGVDNILTKLLNLPCTIATPPQKLL